MAMKNYLSIFLGIPDGDLCEGVMPGEDGLSGY